MRAVASLFCALGVAATLQAEPRRQCEPAPQSLEAFASLVERDWWRLSPGQLDGLWPHPLRDTGCGTEEGRCLDRTWCGLSPSRPDECVCTDQFSFTGPVGRLKLAYIDMTLEVDPDEAHETALRLGDAFEATGRAVAVECQGPLQGAMACYEWSSDVGDDRVAATSIWLQTLDRHTQLSAEAYVIARQP